jgi:hypothetical protein
VAPLKDPELAITESSVFEPWKKFNPRKAAALMNKQRKALRREHARTRRLLRRKVKGHEPTEINRQIDALRKQWVDALIDQALVCEALIEELCTANFLGIVNAFAAQLRLFVTWNEVEQTLQQFGPTPKSNPAQLHRS